MRSFPLTVRTLICPRLNPGFSGGWTLHFNSRGGNQPGVPGPFSSHFHQRSHLNPRSRDPFNSWWDTPTFSTVAVGDCL
jgi:hypothetical protein